MSYLPKTKYGSCCQCPATNTSVIKVGKLTYCISCHRKNKGQQQVQKANERDKQRRQSTTSTQQNQSSKVRSLISSIKNKEVVGDNIGEVELQRWFIHRSKEMTGCCVECNGKTTKGDPKYWKYSICHILGKALFPSVATHPLNFIELCYFGNSHHSNFDNNGYEYAATKMPIAWKIIVERFKLMYPSIKEKSKIPDILIQELEA